MPDLANAIKEPCNNEDCDKCYPMPRWKVSQHRIQHITYQREIKAASAEEAVRIFEEGTAWPSSYDESGGEAVQQDEVKTEKMPPDDYHLTKVCYHDLPSYTSFTFADEEREEKG